MQLSQALHEALSPRLTRLEAQLLMLHTLGRPPCDRAWLLGHDDALLDASALSRFQACCRRRAEGEPVAYITGTKAFFGLDLVVDRRVLDPRADTETLVEWGLQAILGLQGPHILDLGTGSGAVALALAHTRPDAQVCAVDASTDALAVAQANARRLGVPVEFLQGNWFDTTPPLPHAYHLVVSNPPYIPMADPHLAALTHEPHAALASGTDGLDDLRHIIALAPPYLRPGGWLLLEHGYNQAEAVRSLLAQRGFTAVQSRDDIAGISRCSGGRYAGLLAEPSQQ